MDIKYLNIIFLYLDIIRMSTNRWVNWVKQFSKDNNLSYACALSKPECKDSYRAKYGVTKKLTKKQNIEKMGAEDINAPNIQLVVKEKKKRRPTLKLEEVMMEAEDNRSKMVATQEKKKKVLASLPKPKPEPEQIIAPVKTKTQLQKITIGKKKYYLDPRNNVLYESAENVKNKIKAGIWNAETNTIKKIPSKPPPKPKFTAKQIKEMKFRQQTLDLPDEMKREILGFLPKDDEDEIPKTIMKKDESPSDYLDRVFDGWVEYQEELNPDLWNNGELNGISWSNYYDTRKEYDDVATSLLELNNIKMKSKTNWFFNRGKKLRVDFSGSY